MKKAFFLSKKGQTLVEAIVVIAVVVLLVTGLIAGTTFSLKSVHRNQVKTQAVTFAEQGMEIIRTLRDTDWTTFSANSGTYCLGASGSLTAPNPSCPADLSTTLSTYTRTAQFTLAGSTMQVTVSVTSSDGSLASPVTLSTYYTEWK